MLFTILLLPVEDWAKGKCSSYTINSLATFDGNKCGYSVDEIVCTSKMNFAACRDDGNAKLVN